jgi:hypothetical protein
VNVPYLANTDPRLASVTAAEREQLLAGGRPFTFASEQELAQRCRRNAGLKCNSLLRAWNQAQFAAPGAFQIRENAITALTAN